MKRNLTYLFLLLLFLSPSCLRYEGDGEVSPGKGLKVSVAVDPMVDPLTKSAVTAQDEQAKDCNIWIYDDSGIFFEGYYTGFDDIRVNNLIVGNKYKVRAVANVGRLTAPASAEAADAMTFDGGLSSLNSSEGIPMAYATNLTMTMSSSLTVHLKRVAARYTISVNQDNLRGKYTISSLRICNTPSKVLAFTDSRVGVSGITAVEGDCATDADLVSLNSGKEVECFIYENNQGEILAGNSDPWKKEFENYNSDKADYASRCTYLDMIGEYKNDSVTVHDLRYRMYLGKNATTNFDVSRNTAYRIDVNPTEAKMLEESLVSWKLTHGFIDIKGETIVEREYYAPEVVLTYSGDVGADGTAASAPKVTYSQKLKATYDDGHVKDIVVVPAGTTASAGICSFTASTYNGGSFNSSNGVVKGEDLYKDVTPRRRVADVTVTLTSNGKTGSDDASVYQEANEASYGSWYYEGESSTTSYRNPSVSIFASPSTFTAAGGTSYLSCSASYEQATDRTWTSCWRIVYYTSGVNDVEYGGGGSETGSWSSKSAPSSDISISDNGASGFSRSGTKVTVAENSGEARSFVCYADFKDPAGHSATRASVTITQDEKLRIVKTVDKTEWDYQNDEWDDGHWVKINGKTSDSKSVGAASGSVTVTATAGYTHHVQRQKRSRTYKEYTWSDGSVTTGDYGSWSSWSNDGSATKSDKSGTPDLSSSDSWLRTSGSYDVNTGTSSRKATITASYGGASATLIVSQAGKPDEPNDDYDIDVDVD